MWKAKLNELLEAAAAEKQKVKYEADDLPEELKHLAAS